MTTRSEKVEKKHSRMIGDTVGLLVIQPTPFCNINCDYCYLPERTANSKMSSSVLKETLEKVFASGMVGDRLSIVWHAGEPLAVPISFYEEAFKTIDSLAISTEKIGHCIQTNGTLINDRWCEFIKTHDIRIGVSIDGPEFVHDAHRKDRFGRGTHARVMEGVNCLRKHGIDFHVIAVVTEQSLDHPDEVFNFFLEQGIRQVGFNIEEIEGENHSSTLSPNSVEVKVKRFFERIFDLQKQAKGAVRIREFDRAFQAILAISDPNAPDLSKGNDQTVPFGIISVDTKGNFSSFSPELLGMKSSEYGDFYFGNLVEADLLSASHTDKFQRVVRDIQKGKQICSQSCEYYFLCGGGAPSNKYYENGTFASGETMFCRNSIKTPLDIVLADLELSLNIDGCPKGEIAPRTL